MVFRSGQLLGSMDKNEKGAYHAIINLLPSGIAVISDLGSRMGTRIYPSSTNTTEPYCITLVPGRPVIIRDLDVILCGPGTPFGITAIDITYFRNRQADLTLPIRTLKRIVPFDMHKPWHQRFLTSKGGREKWVSSMVQQVIHENSGYEQMLDWAEAEPRYGLGGGVWDLSSGVIDSFEASVTAESLLGHVSQSSTSGTSDDEDESSPDTSTEQIKAVDELPQALAIMTIEDDISTTEGDVVTTKEDAVTVSGRPGTRHKKVTVKASAA